MTPSGPWVAEFADHSCALMRNFEQGDHSAMLELRQFLPGRLFEITAASPTLERRDRKLRTAVLPDDETEAPRTYRRVDGDDNWEGFIYTDTIDRNGESPPVPGSPQAIARDAAITGVSIQNGFSSDIVFETGPLDEAMRIMRHCTDDLVSAWGLDPQQQRNLSRQVDLGSKVSWFRQFLQISQRIEREYGIDNLKLLLLVDEDGNVTRCRATNLPDDVAAENAACEHVLKSADLQPALDANGHAVASYYLLWGYVVS
ncbi:hypothetical protein GCM10023208_06280 [Erythrobacter westpacificensis]|uniref:Uncharacterized protein n=2 Tax=Erythrobacter westpacificensis TaxID=1055231 RepID=A0ABP9K0J3_9SPHN